MRVRVRGVVYESVGACANHFGVKPDTVLKAIAKGREDYIGLLAMSRHRRSCIRVRGMEFETLKACAAHFGVTPNTVSQMVASGRADYIGLGKRRSEHPSKQSKPFVLAGVSYPSGSEASRALGMHRSFVNRVLRTRGEAAGMAYLSALAAHKLRKAA